MSSLEVDGTFWMWATPFFFLKSLSRLDWDIDLAGGTSMPFDLADL